MNRIKLERERIRKTQEEFSKMFEPPIPVSTIKKWDAGISKPQPWVVSLIIEHVRRKENESTN